VSPVWHAVRAGKPDISAAEIFKARCQLHVASRRAANVCFAMISGKSETEAAEVSTTTAGWKKGAAGRPARGEGEEEAGRRVRRHSSGTVKKRHDGISEIALDIFACTLSLSLSLSLSLCVCVGGSRTAASSSSLLLLFSSVSFHAFAKQRHVIGLGKSLIS